MAEILEREFIYLWYYFLIMFEQIAPYWLFGIITGSFISSFGGERVHQLLLVLQGRRIGISGLILASLLGIASPICAYGTIPILASLSRKGLRDDWLGAFMMSSILLNPQLLVYSIVLGKAVLITRFISCFTCGVLMGLLIRFLYGYDKFFNFSSFLEPVGGCKSSSGVFLLLKNVFKNVKATWLNLLIGIFLSVLFQLYVPKEDFANLFGSYRGFGVLMAAGLGVPLYICGGGTIPLIMEWLDKGMSLGAVTAFMIVGPATKFTNLGAIKVILDARHFMIYLLYVSLFAILSGLLVNKLLIG